LSNAAKGIYGSGPSGDPDAPRVRPKGDLGVYVSDGDVRAAVRQSRGERLPGRRAPELTLENEIRRNLRLQKLDERC
jgi:hypothetical protein